MQAVLIMERSFLAILFGFFHYFKSSEVGAHRKTVYIDVYMPCNPLRGSTRLDFDESVLAIYLAVTRIQKEGLLDPQMYDISFETVKLHDTECNANVALKKLLTRREENEELPFALGLLCEEVCYAISKLYTSFNKDIPLISIGCRAIDFAAPFPQASNVFRIGGSITKIIRAIFAIIDRFPSWKSVAVVATMDHESFTVSRIIMNMFKSRLNKYPRTVTNKILPDCTNAGFSDTNQYEESSTPTKIYFAAKEYLKTVQSQTDVFILATHECAAVNFMKAADGLNLMRRDNSKHAFITYLIYLDNDMKVYTSGSNFKVQAFDGVLSVNLKKPYKLTWSEFESTLRQFKNIYNEQFKNQQRRELRLGTGININSALLFDSVYLLAKAINASEQFLHATTWNYSSITRALSYINDESPIPNKASMEAGFYFNFASGHFKTVPRDELETFENFDDQRLERDVNLAIEMAQDGKMKTMYELEDEFDRKFFERPTIISDDLTSSEDQSYAQIHVPNFVLQKKYSEKEGKRARYDFNSSEIILTRQRGTFWWPGKSISPPDRSLKCRKSFNKIICDSSENGLQGIMLKWSYDLILSLILLAIFLSTYIMSLNSTSGTMKSEVWSKNESFKIRWDEILTPDKENFDGYNVLLQESRRKKGSNIELNDKDFYTKVGIYKAQVCSILRINSNIERINYKNPVFIEEIRQMANIRHQNLNLFLGVCLDMPNSCLVYLYNKFGSLADVIREKIVANPSVDNKLSLILDISAGMEYLHRTALKVHGHLNSKNCVIDNRWTCKITDYGINLLHAEKVGMVHKSKADCLYLAPELMRIAEECMDPVDGTKEGDIYAFGIIMHEVTIWDQPYALERKTQPLSQIIRKIMAISQKPFRPQISTKSPPGWKEIIEGCLKEKSYERLSFATVNLELKRLTKGKTLHIMDVTLEKLEKLNQRLQILVAKRTEELKQKKAEVEAWIFNILPKDIAIAMLNNEMVRPEEFEEATIYFSDIVGFHVILQSDSPSIVINFLNDVFKQFDLVTNRYELYKCETTKDIYMVVSGVPKRLERHASEAATMALEMFGTIFKFKIPGTKDNILQLRIGLHSGPLVAGVLGTTLPQYCMYGDTVNVASRMQTSGYALKIHISQTTANLLMKDGVYELEERGEIFIKGKGQMRTYWLKGKRGTGLTVPDPSLAAPPHLHKFK